jgi:hypothetical protein
MNILENIGNGIMSNIDVFSFEEGITEDRYKKFAELCIFMNYCSPDHFGSNYIMVKNYLLEKIKTIPADDIFKNPYMVFHIAMPYVFLRKFEKNELLESALKIMFQNKMFLFEVPPHRQMEWNFIKSKMGLSNISKVSTTSILNSNVYLCAVNREMAYAISHSLFYITDFGFAPPPKDLLNIEKLKFQLECLIVKFYKENDLDVVLELCVNYFSLVPHTDLNFNILKVADACIQQNSFIDNAYSESVFIQKYHSLFVIGILFSQLSAHVNNPDLKNDIKEKLRVVVEATVFSQNTINQTANKKIDDNAVEFLAWEALQQLNNKEMNQEGYKRYIATYGNNKYLELEIISNLKLLKHRNEKKLLWDREFEYLKVDKKTQNRLINEYQNNIESALQFHKSNYRNQFVRA